MLPHVLESDFVYSLCDVHGLLLGLKKRRLIYIMIEYSRIGRGWGLSFMPCPFTQSRFHLYCAQKCMSCFFRPHESNPVLTCVNARCKHIRTFTNAFEIG